MQPKIVILLKAMEAGIRSSRSSFSPHQLHSAYAIIGGD